MTTTETPPVAPNGLQYQRILVSAQALMDATPSIRDQAKEVVQKALIDANPGTAYRSILTMKPVGFENVVVSRRHIERATLKTGIPSFDDRLAKEISAVLIEYGVKTDFEVEVV